MLAKGRILLFFCLLVLVVGCWDKQSHEVLAPEIPHYDLTGHVSDIDSHDVLQHVIVTIEPVKIFHPVEFMAISDTTDSTGAFFFPDIIIPGNYMVVSRRNDVICDKYEFTQAYVPEILDLRVPKPLLCEASYWFPNYPAYYGICWKNVYKCASVIDWIVNPGAPTVEAYPRIGEGTPGDGFNVMGAKRLDPENPGFHGLTILRNYWAASLEKPFDLYEINPGNSKIIRKVKCGIALTDLTTDGSHIWASAGNGMIYKFGGEPPELVQIFGPVGRRLRGIAWRDSSVWTSDADDNLLTKRDENMQVVATYRTVVLDYWYQYIDDIVLSYICFDESDRLWGVCGESIYQFEMIK